MKRFTVNLLVLFIVLTTIISNKTLFAQDTIPISLSLRNVVDLAVQQSYSVKYVQNQNVSYYWRYKNFTKRFLPQLSIESEFPLYSHTTSPITQPDGTIKFKQISNLQNSATLSLSQSIPKLGTSVYVASSIYRIQDFNLNSTEFSGSPFEIGFSQPIFAYNWMKWYKKTEPLVYEEAQRDFLESIEEIALAATKKFFTYLTVQTNYNLAESNLKNSQDNLKIADMKKKLGQISENDYSRIKLSVFNAKKALNEAKMNLKNADFELKSYIGLEQGQQINLEMPLNMILFEIDPERALEESLANRKEPLYYQRRLIQADAQLIQAKRNSGPSITIEGNYGVSNSNDEFYGVYQNTQQQRELELTLSIPILDWGSSASQIKLAESNRDLVTFDVEQDMKDFKRGVVVQVEQFSLLKDQLQTVKEADIVAENGYKIALKKFQNGEISITDLNISLSERETAKRDYISSLKNYWVAYYNLRILTLYDFELDQKISYENPLLGSM